ncbi:MAG: UTP--glucose-1-phosphate uridylyltransferase [Alphaproteobacteria bacterium]|nr:UTP--glucose-1-phosphate uridylyltransferase [Alphaproteobacteria bacterium]NCQ87534.1 UTP--glucose-1-phosphate uridylyltransferase [Alphaproteobacteria bacterium]NCT06402.1 UTP--glucose-1-phosphate uridylyltransferase [Alphaproteobacteria bacterium]
MAQFKPVRKAVFPVAGLGTRFLPATKAMPKEMLPINDRPLIQHVYEEARDAGIEEFIFVTGRQKEMLEEHFDYQPELMQTLEARGKEDMVKKVRDCEMPAGKLFLTRQPCPLGLGHAIWCAKKLIGDEPFAILLPDDLVLNKQGCLSQMIDVYNKNGGNVVAVKNVPKEDTSKYGIVDTDNEGDKTVSIKGLVEKPDPANAPSTLSIVGRYILQPEVLDHLAAFETGAGNEIQLTDSMAKLIGYQPFHGLRFDGDHFDCGSRLGFIEANIAYGLADKDIGNNVKTILKNYS